MPRRRPARDARRIGAPACRCWPASTSSLRELRVEDAPTLLAMLTHRGSVAFHLAAADDRRRLRAVHRLGTRERELGNYICYGVVPEGMTSADRPVPGAFARARIWLAASGASPSARRSGAPACSSTGARADPELRRRRRRRRSASKRVRRSPTAAATARCGRSAPCRKACCAARSCATASITTRCCGRSSPRIGACSASEQASTFTKTPDSSSLKARRLQRRAFL